MWGSKFATLSMRERRETWRGANFFHLRQSFKYYEKFHFFHEGEGEVEREKERERRGERDREQRDRGEGERENFEGRFSHFARWTSLLFTREYFRPLPASELSMLLISCHEKLFLHGAPAWSLGYFENCHWETWYISGCQKCNPSTY